MKFLRIALGLLLIFSATIGLTLGIVTFIEREELVISSGFFVKKSLRPFVIVEYRFDRDAEAEEISQRGLFARHMSVVFSGKCDCVLSFRDGDKDESVTEQDSGDFLFLDRIASKILSREDAKVKEMLKEGRKLRDEMRKRFENYFYRVLNPGEPVRTKIWFSL